jgi:hypothetical protein
MNATDQSLLDNALYVLAQFGLRTEAVADVRVFSVPVGYRGARTVGVTMDDGRNIEVVCRQQSGIPARVQEVLADGRVQMMQSVAPKMAAAS